MDKIEVFMLKYIKVIYMNKFEFYKDNKKMDLDGTITFNHDELKIIKDTSDYTIMLDFQKKQCQFTLKNHKLSLNINVINMNYFQEENCLIFNYILETEPEVKNTIKIMI